MELNELVQAIQTLNAEDAFRTRLTADQWRSIAPYLTRHEIRAGDLLIKQGDADRTMYFLAQGSLQVFVSGGAPGSSRKSAIKRLNARSSRGSGSARSTPITKCMPCGRCAAIAMPVL